MELEVQSGFGVYETRGPCQKIAFIQLAVSLCSFFLTWYRVYWETLIFMGVSFIGVIATREPIDHSKTRLANAYYYGNITAIAAQVIAVGCLIYYLLEAHVLAKNLDLNEFGSTGGIWAFFFFLLAVLTGHIILSSYGILRAKEYRSELLRSESAAVYTELPQKY